MTRIEKAVRIVSDLYDFYGKTPKIPKQDPVREEKHDQALQRTVQQRVSHSLESPPARRR